MTERGAKERLHDILIEAVIKNPDHKTAAAEAAWIFIKEDRSLLIELFGNVRSRILEGAIDRAIREDNSPTRQAQLKRVGRGRLLTSRKAIRIAKVWQDDRDRFQDHLDSLATKHTADTFKAVSEIVETYAEKRLEDYKKSCLFKFVINGRPIGELLVTEVTAWRDAYASHVTFVDMLTSGISHHDKRPIKDIIEPRDADDMWARSHGLAKAA